jgi:hypothetical protein
MQALDADGDGELSAKEIENATAALKTLDKDGDGKLGRDELRPAIGGRGPGGGPGQVNPEPLVSQFMTFDKNADGKLAKDELPERMQSLIERADANKDGFVDRAELTEFARQQLRRNPGGPGSEPGPGGGEGGRRGRPRQPGGRDV